MSNKNIELVHTESDILSIRLSTNGFSFSIYNPERKENLYFQTVSVNIQHSMAGTFRRRTNGTAFLSESSQAK